MSYRQKKEDLTDAIAALIAEETDDATAEDLLDQIELLSSKALEIHTSSAIDSDEEIETEDDFLDYQPDMDEYSEEN
jgi:hypothetical protein